VTAQENNYEKLEKQKFKSNHKRLRDKDILYILSNVFVPLKQEAAKVSV